MATEYTPEFYDTIARSSIESAAVIVPLFVERYGAPQTVLDIGCGQGWWAREFQRHGAEVLGIDGDYVTEPQIPFLAHDLQRTLPDMAQVDLVVCLEVAEHLPEQRAVSFVHDLVRLGRFVLFSAAIPHQTGAGHVNLQWPSHWARLFREAGYGCDDKLRWDVWADERVAEWYQQNVLVFAGGFMPNVPHDVVHPTIHEWGRTT